jgi:hypothetical protein
MMFFFFSFPADIPFIQEPPVVAAPTTVIQTMPTPTVGTSTSSRKRPARTLGLVGTNAAFLIPDHIRKKFADGWTSHVPLTYLTDKGCLFKNKAAVAAAQEVLSFDSSTGQVITTSKPLMDNGELDLTFDEWHQAWRRLLELITTYFPEELPLWEKHFNFILNNENRAELWPVYLAYDAEIRRRTTYYSIDPSMFSIGIWNDLEGRYATRKVLSMVQSGLKQNPERYLPSHQNNPPSYTPRNTSQNIPQNTSFRNQHQSSSDGSKTGRCIFCGDCSKTHLSRNCGASCYANGSPCHMHKNEASGNRQSPTGRRYCFAWNGPSGCNQIPCTRGEHWCTLCGNPAHNAQRCDIVA